MNESKSIHAEKLYISEFPAMELEKLLPIDAPVAALPELVVPVQTYTLGDVVAVINTFIGDNKAPLHKFPEDTCTPSTVYNWVGGKGARPMCALASVVELDTIACQVGLFPPYVYPLASEDTILSYVERSLLVASVVDVDKKTKRNWSPGLSPVGVAIGPAEAEPAACAASANTDNTNNNLFI